MIGHDVSSLDGDLAVSAVTFAELHFGILVARTAAVRAERLRRLTYLERRFDPLPVDGRVAASYGRLASAVAAVGRQPRPRALDLLIAATAHSQGARLCTRDTADLAGLGDLIEIVAA